jgi:hypothetical protein
MKQNLMFSCFCVLSFISCIDNQEIIQKEIKLKEARRGLDLKNFTIHLKHTVKDTSAVYFKATVKVNRKDSVFSDSIFFVKGSDGVLLPFSSNPQTGNKVISP